MQHVKSLFLTLGATLVSAQALAGSTFTCTGPDISDVRKVEVVQETDSGLPCTTLYTKNGETSEVARAEYTAGFCDTVSQNVVTNLEAASFDCVADVAVEQFNTEEFNTEQLSAEQFGSNEVNSNRVDSNQVDSILIDSEEVEAE